MRLILELAITGVVFSSCLAIASVGVLGMIEIAKIVVLLIPYSFLFSNMLAFALAQLVLSIMITCFIVYKNKNGKVHKQSHTYRQIRGSSSFRQ